jgi:hypothetical protein
LSERASARKRGSFLARWSSARCNFRIVSGGF